MEILKLGLQDLPLFRGLQPQEINTFVEHTASVIKRYDKGTLVLCAYESNTQIGVVVDGLAQVITEDRLGNESIGHDLERGALFGSTSAILSEEYSVASIKSLSALVVLWIPYRSLLVAGPKLGRIHGIVMKNLLEAFCIKNVHMLEKLEILSQKSLRERIILYLLQREKRQKTNKVKVPRRIQFAKDLECNRSALTRELAQMKEDGLLLADADWMCLIKDHL